jgi:hypothetical protein
MAHMKAVSALRFSCAVRHASNDAASHRVPAVWDVVASMAAAWRSSGPPMSLGELVWGTQIVAARHQAMPAHERARVAGLCGRTVSDRALHHELAECLDLAAAAYKSTLQAAASVCKLKVASLLHASGRPLLILGAFRRSAWWCPFTPLLKQ